MHCDWKRRHSRLWLANPTLWKGQARVLWMSEVLHSQYVGWLKHANILQHSEPSMISGRKNIHKHSTWWKDSLWHCEILLSIFGQFCRSSARLDMCRSDFCRVMAMQCAWSEILWNSGVKSWLIVISFSGANLPVVEDVTLLHTVPWLPQLSGCWFVGLDSSHFSCFCPPFVTLVC